MTMAYTINPNLPRLRMEAVKLVRSGQSIRSVARHFGYSHGAVIRWLAHARDLRPQAQTIPTRSSRPRHHPRELPEEVVSAILHVRAETRRCAEVVHHLLGQDGITVSLSSVKRVLRRHGLVNHSKWKKWHTYPPRPVPETPGTLVEIDTIHDGEHADRLYVYTLIDVCSRWAHAWPAERITTHRSLRFIERAHRAAPFSFQTLQSDHGAEFSKWLTVQLQARRIAHRHSRVRMPSDNGHLERFNWTLQDECLRRNPRSFASYRRAVTEYLHYYNHERPHLGLGMKTPLEVVTSY